MARAWPVLEKEVRLMRDGKNRYEQMKADVQNSE